MQKTRSDRRQSWPALAAPAPAAAVVAVVAALCLGSGVGVPFRAAAAPQQKAPSLTNAALARFGARVSLQTAAGGSRDPNTPPSSTFDNDVHTRCVLRGSLPYTFTITLPFPMPVAHLAFAHSDYAAERAPKDIEIALDDGTTLRHTLELRRPESRRRPAWQEVPVGKTVRVVRVTVLSDHPAGSESVNYGGLGEIAVLTTENLAAKLIVAGAEAVTGAGAPAFVHVPTPALGVGGRQRAASPVLLPPRAAAGEHPCLLFTRAELAEFKAEVATSERARAALAALKGKAEAALKAPPDFPDPKGPPGQLKDRGDAVAKRHSALSQTAGSLGLAYALTGDARYAARAADILRGYAERYDAYPEHQGANRNDTGKVMAQRLSEAMWLIPLIEAYDYIYDSSALTAEDRRKIETALIRPAITFIRRKEPAAEVAARDQANPDWRTAFPAKGGAANWLLYYNAATMMAGAVLNDTHLRDLAAADFRALLANGIGEDGLWREGAIGYQFFALTALVPGIEAAARQGIDLWSFDNNRLQRLFDSPLRFAYPDGTAPGINDSGRARLGDWSTMVYDYAHLRYGAGAGYASLVNASPRQLHMSEAVYFPTRVYRTLPETGASPHASAVFDSVGYAILRDSRRYALIDYGGHGGTHGHFDKLNLILFAAAPDGKGDEMGGEPRFHRYEDPLHAEWTTQTVAHNTLTVDETSQTPSAGRLLAFEDTPTLKVMRAASTQSAPGAVLDRTVVVTPDAVIDLFHGRSSYARTWDRTFRFQGELRGLPAAGDAPELLGKEDGYQHLRVVARHAAERPWSGAWQTTQGAFAVTVAGAPGQAVILTRGPDDDAIALARQEKRSRADFAAAYALEGWGNPVTAVRQIPASGEDAPAGVEMTQADGSVTQVIVAHAPGEWTALGWRSDARVLCVRRPGGGRGPVQALLVGGTFAEGKDGVIKGSTAGNYVAERPGAGGAFKVLSAWTP